MLKLTSDQVATLAERWSVGPIRALREPATGAINQVVVLDTAGGRYVLRAYRTRRRVQVELEHAIAAWVAKRGLPAVAPLPLPDGTTIVAQDERFVALFPYAAGSQRERSALTLADCAALGRCLARLHAVLEPFAHPGLGRRPLDLDTAAVLAQIADYERRIPTGPHAHPTDAHALRHLAGQRRWLIAHAPLKLPPLETLPYQPIHGDFTETNVFFARDEVSAIFDWDQAYCAPRAWELIRTLDLVCGFAPAPARALIAGYREHAPLDDAALDLAAGWYAAMRAHDLWKYAAIYDQGNDRVRCYMTPEGFQDLAAGWLALRRQLNI